jgi:hypothetical protein
LRASHIANEPWVLVARDAQVGGLLPGSKGYRGEALVRRRDGQRASVAVAIAGADVVYATQAIASFATRGGPAAYTYRRRATDRWSATAGDRTVTIGIAAGARPGAVSRACRARRVRSGHMSARRLMALAIAL